MPDVQRLFLSVTLSIAVVVSGCSNEEERQAVAARKTTLQELGKAYIAFCEQSGVGPANATELADFIDGSQPSPDATEASKRLREGEVIMYWSIDWSATKQGKAQYVLGFEPGVLRSGGYIVTAEPSVKLVNAQSFQKFQTPAKAEAVSANQ